MRLVFRCANWFFVGTIALLSTAAPLQSRPWPRNAPNAADYLVINDNRGNGDLVLVLWLASPLIPDSAGKQSARDLLDKYVIIGVVHAHVNKDATFRFDTVGIPEITGFKNEKLQLLDMETMSPAIVGSLATLKAAFGQMFGQFGKGIQWFVYAKGSVNPCSNGGLAVQFENEKYTYAAPVPGCPST